MGEYADMILNGDVDIQDLITVIDITKDAESINIPLENFKK